MRRDYVSLEVRNVDSSGVPTVHVEFDGPSDQLVGRLTDDGGAQLAADELDVAYRLQGDGTGVVGLSNRVTGEFILEANASDHEVLEFIRAARDHGAGAAEEGRYRLVVVVGDEAVVDHELGTLLVYDAGGDLRRSDSLIPSGVEL